MCSCFVTEVRADCTTGLSLPTPASTIQFGHADPGNCDTLLDSIETDTCSTIWLAGTTKSKSISFSVTEASCYTNPVGFVTQMSGSTIQWTKIFDGMPSESEQVQSVPWIKTSLSSGYADPTNSRDTVTIALLLKL